MFHKKGLLALAEPLAWNRVKYGDKLQSFITAEVFHLNSPQMDFQSPSQKLMVAR